MPYSNNTELPTSVRSKYSARCQSVFRRAFNSAHAKHGETRAFQVAHTAARNCMESTKDMDNVTTFNLYSGLLKAFTAEDGTRRIRTTASSTATDRRGHEITEGAIRNMAASAKNNMTIFLNHSYKVPEDVFGSVEDVAVINRDGVWDLDFEVRLNEANPRAVKTYEAIQGGTKLATSIGANIIRDKVRKSDGGGQIFDDLELVEASIVALPANPRTWIHYMLKALKDAPLELDGDDSEEEEEEHTHDEEEETTEEAAAPVPPSSSIEPTAVVAESTLVAESEAPDETEPAQEGQPTEPETADAPAEEPAAEEEAEETSAIPEGLTEFSELVGLLKSAMGELVDTRKERDEEHAGRIAAETERDKAIADLGKAQSIVEGIAALPIGRRTGFDDYVREFRTKFSDVYGDDFLKMLEKPHES